MKVLVTGGSGFIGKKLIDILIKNKITVVFITRKIILNDIPKSLYIQPFVTDLLVDENNFSNLLDGVSCVYNCAGELNNESLMYALHVNATEKLLNVVIDTINKTNTPIHWVQLSSVGAYGTQTPANKPRIVTENTICDPIGTYESTKTIADNLIISIGEKNKLFSYTILRPSNVIGENMTNNSFRALILMIQKELFFYIGYKNAISTYIYVNDVADAIFLCGSNDLAKNQIFNLSKDCFLFEIVNEIARVLKVKTPTVHLPVLLIRLIIFLTSWTKKLPLTHSRLNALIQQTRYPSDKIKTILGYTPKSNIVDIAAKIALQMDK